MGRVLLFVVVLSSLTASFTSAADAEQAKAIEKYAAQWDWKESRDAFLKANKEAPGNELPGSDKSLGYLLLSSDRCASTDHELEAHGFLGGDKVLVRCLVDEQALKAAEGGKGFAARLGKLLGVGAELPVDDGLKKEGLEALWYWRDGGADHDVTLMVYKDKVIVEVADVALKKALQEKQAKKK